MVQALCRLTPAVLIALMVGCSAETATVSGTVKVDGQLLEKGVISFASADGKGSPVTATIQNGRYEVQTTPGQKIVQISAPIVTGKRKEYNAPDAPLIDLIEESLPTKYHSESELKFEVKSGGNSKDWELESIRKKK